MIDIKSIFGKKVQQDTRTLTAQDFINVKDIRGSILYGKDNTIFAYIKLAPISLDLLSENEKKTIMRRLTAELSTETRPFKFIGISRAIDISRLLHDLQDTYAQSEDMKQRHLLLEQVKYISDFATTGEVVERQFYIIIWSGIKDDAEQELLKRALELAQKFDSCGIQAEVADQNMIVQLCNLYANPSYGHLEDSNIEPTVPILNMKGGVFG